MLIFTALGGAAVLMVFGLDRFSKMKERLDESQHNSVVKSVDSMLQLMVKFQDTQSSLEKSVAEIKMNHRELEIKFGYFVETMNQYYNRGPVINTGDGRIMDPGKVNRQKP